MVSVLFWQGCVFQYFLLVSVLPLGVAHCFLFLNKKILPLHRNQRKGIMVITDNNISKRLKEGTLPADELAKYLLDTYPTPVLAKELAECLIGQQASKPMLITMEEFQAHFRVKGTKWVDGQMVPDGRGSLRWGKK